MTDVIRKSLTDQLSQALPSNWKIYPFVPSLDQVPPRQVVGILNLKSVTKLPAAPNSHREAHYIFSVIVPSTDPEKREDNLDDALIDFLGAVDDLPSLYWDSAERGVYQSGYVGFDIGLSHPYINEPEGA